MGKAGGRKLLEVKTLGNFRALDSEVKRTMLNFRSESK